MPTMRMATRGMSLTMVRNDTRRDVHLVLQQFSRVMTAAIKGGLSSVYNFILQMYA